MLLEGIVIVLSILLAFTIDSGWEELQERRAEAEILQALSAEFKDYKEQFTLRVERYDQMAELIAWFLDEAEFLPSDIDRLDRAMLTFVGAATIDIGSGVHAELVASGRVSLISDHDLRQIVSTWEGLLEETADNEVVVREYVTNVVVPYLASLQAPIGRGARTTKEERWRLSVPSEAEALARYRTLANDPEFRALATWRYDWALGSAREFRLAVAAADSALVLVRASRGD